MQSVLIILGMYYPRYSANGLCVRNVVNELINRGYDVTCICNGTNNMKSVTIEGASIHYIKPRLHQKISNASMNVKGEFLSKMLNRISLLVGKAQLFVGAYNWPYISPLYMRHFYKKARKLYIENKYDIVVSVYTPFEALYAGYKLKKSFPELKFVPYYLDAFAGGWGPSFFSKEKTELNTRRWERKINSVANLVISMNSVEMYHRKNSLGNDEKRVYLDVPVMLPPLKKQDIQCEPYAIYAGNLSYSSRNINVLLEVFSEVYKKTGIRLILIGECKEINKYKKYLGHGMGIEYMGRLPHKQVLELEGKATYLVNIGSTNPYTIPSKIFEYMRFDKPIISTLSIDDEPSIEYLKQYGKVFFMDERRQINELVNDLVVYINSEKNTNPSIDCEKVFYKNTPKAFVDIIEMI